MKGDVEKHGSGGDDERMEEGEMRMSGGSGRGVVEAPGSWMLTWRSRLRYLGILLGARSRWSGVVDTLQPHSNVVRKLERGRVGGGGGGGASKYRYRCR